MGSRSTSRMARRCGCGPSGSLVTSSPNILQRIVLMESLDGIGGGKGGYWEDQGYTWYGGI